MELEILNIDVFNEITELVSIVKQIAQLKIKARKTAEERKLCIISHIKALIENIKDHIQDKLGCEIEWGQASSSSILQGSDPQERQINSNIDTQIKDKIDEQTKLLTNFKEQILQQLSQDPKNMIIKDLLERQHMSLLKIENIISQQSQTPDPDLNIKNLESNINRMIEGDSLTIITEKCDTIQNTVTDLTKINENHLKTLQFKNQEQTNEILRNQQLLVQILRKITIHQDDNFIQQNPINMEIVNNDLQCVKITKLQELSSYTDEGEHYVIMPLQNGNYIVGGYYEQLILLDQQLQFIKYIDIPGTLQAGIAVGNYLYCYIKSRTISVIYQNTFGIIKDIDIQSSPFKLSMMKYNFLIIGQDNGYIDIIQISTLNNVFKCQLTNEPYINDIVRMNNNNQYAFATKEGLIITTFTFQNKNITFIENEMYLEDREIYKGECINDNVLIVGEYKCKKLQLVDIQSNQVTFLDQCGIFNGDYILIQRMPGYDSKIYPFVIVQDQIQIVILNVKKLQIHSIINQFFDISINCDDIITNIFLFDKNELLTIYEESIKKFKFSIDDKQ